MQDGRLLQCGMPKAVSTIPSLCFVVGATLFLSFTLMEFQRPLLILSAVREYRVLSHDHLSSFSRDWSEHRLICGFKDIPGPRDLDVEQFGKDPNELFTPPERFPFRFRPAEDQPWAAFTTL